MIIEQRQWTTENQWQTTKAFDTSLSAQLVLVFGSRELLSDPAHFSTVRAFYPDAHIVMSSTAGEIHVDSVFDESMSLTAIHFNSTKVQVASVPITDMKRSFTTGHQLAQQLAGPDLAHIIVLSNGLNVNGSDLIKGINASMPKTITCTGGLAGDAARFERTLVGANAAPADDQVVAIGFYGQSLKVGYGSVGGWDYFGAERLVTRSEGNVLYELDGQSALELYKMYLGEKSKELPGSALLFPLGMKFDENSETIVRTVLGVDEVNKSMTFAGDLPEGSYVCLMRTNFDRLVNGAGLAAEYSQFDEKNTGDQLALLISCVGRKLILGQRVQDEVEAVRDVLGQDVFITGFYSYGEISPIKEHATCELHNQTMTITTLVEVG